MAHPLPVVPVYVATSPYNQSTCSQCQSFYIHYFVNIVQLKEEYKLQYASYLESKEETLDDLLVPPPSKKSKTSAASKESHFLKTPEYFYALAKGAQFKEEFPTYSPHELRMLVLEHFANLSNKKKVNLPTSPLSFDICVRMYSRK